MTRRSDLDRLREMAEMVMQARTRQVRAAAEVRDAIRAQLAELDSAPAPDAADLAAMQASFAFEGWAAQRRADLNLRLAAAQAEWLTHLHEARRSVGKAQVIERLRDRYRPPGRPVAE